MFELTEFNSGTQKNMKLSNTIGHRFAIAGHPTYSGLGFYLRLEGESHTPIKFTPRLRFPPENSKPLEDGFDSRTGDKTRTRFRDYRCAGVPGIRNASEKLPRGSPEANFSTSNIQRAGKSK